jgi:hypothetical protein
MLPPPVGVRHHPADRHGPTPRLGEADRGRWACSGSRAVPVLDMAGKAGPRRHPREPSHPTRGSRTPADTPPSDSWTAPRVLTRWGVAIGPCICLVQTPGLKPPRTDRAPEPAGRGPVPFKACDRPEPMMPSTSLTVVSSGSRVPVRVILTDEATGRSDGRFCLDGIGSARPERTRASGRGVQRILDLRSPRRPQARTTVSTELVPLRRGVARVVSHA